MPSPLTFAEIQQAVMSEANTASAASAYEQQRLQADMRLQLTNIGLTPDMLTFPGLGLCEIRVEISLVQSWTSRLQMWGTGGVNSVITLFGGEAWQMPEASYVLVPFRSSNQILSLIMKLKPSGGWEFVDDDD